MDRRYTYLAFVGGLALLAGSAVAQLKFPVGEDSKFNWASFEEFKTALECLSCPDDFAVRVMNERIFRFMHRV